MKGANATLSARNYGSYEVVCIAYGHGLTIVADQDYSRNGRAFYASKVTTGEFGIALIFSNWVEFTRFEEWLVGYGHRASDPDGNVGMMRVIIPAYGFDRSAIPMAGIVFGDDVRSITWRVMLSFGGGVEPGEFRVSGFVAPRADDPALSYFYPAGTQLAGSAGGTDTFYDDDTPYLTRIGGPF